jgi:alanyl-tRNA synthetase
MAKVLSGNEIRQTFIDFFAEHGHTVVPSASLVPGGDATLLFTNSGMVQFKDVFIGTDVRPYTRAVDSQKCMRVAGKHNDLEDVGRDDTHHTFFEMLGNWSFGDYYKKEAIAWSWQLLTEVWGLPKDKLYATCFKDDKGNIPTDEEAADIWRTQPGMNPENILYYGRKENLWQMAEFGPCGPCSEIHIDLGEERDNMHGTPHKCGVNGDCTRYLELWNNVFIQYNMLEGGTLEPLPATHVDTGMGFERIVSVLQNVDSNYKTDLFAPMIEVIRKLSGHSLQQVYADFTPFRVIADHTRAAAFLIADGVVPGNTGRNYICRMIIRRGARFASKIGLHKPFMAQVVEPVIEAYGAFYPELVQHKQSILDSITREEIRFSRTVESGTAYLQGMLDELKKEGKTVLDGRKAFDLYATYGLPLELSRDIAKEQDLDVDEKGFLDAREQHSIASGGGRSMGSNGGNDTEFFGNIYKKLIDTAKLKNAVEYDPYTSLSADGEVLAMVVNGEEVNTAQFGDAVEIILPKTTFYIESGGQVGDTGLIRGHNSNGAVWEVEVSSVRRPASGLISHIGEVISGKPCAGDKASALVDNDRRRDIMRNHTATHLMHAALHKVLGPHARQAGSLVAPDRLRFDFNHPESMTPAQIEQVEQIVNQAISADYEVRSKTRSREEAIAEGAMALFGEKYGDVVRTITILDDDPQEEGTDRYSFELCGGTHIKRSSDVGSFIIVSEGSAAAGVRRIEAVTGRGAFDLTAKRFKALKTSASILKTNLDDVPGKIDALQDELSATRKQLAEAKAQVAVTEFGQALANPTILGSVSVVVANLPGLDKETLTRLSDVFRDKYPQNGVCAVFSVKDGQVSLMVGITQDLVKQGYKAGEVVGYISKMLGAGGGGAPHLAFGGGKDLANLGTAQAYVVEWVRGKQG